MKSFKRKKERDEGTLVAFAPEDGQGGIHQRTVWGKGLTVLERKKD